MDHLQQHRTNLLNSITREYAQLESNLRAEIAHQKTSSRLERQRYDDEIRRLGKEASKANSLKDENHELRRALQLAQSQLRQREERFRDEGELGEHVDGSSGQPGPPNGSWRDNYDKLRVKYCDLKSNYRRTRASLETLYVKSKKNIENFKAWREYWARHGNQIPGKSDFSRRTVAGDDSPSRSPFVNRIKLEQDANPEEDLPRRSRSTEPIKLEEDNELGDESFRHLPNFKIEEGGIRSDEDLLSRSLSARPAEFQEDDEWKGDLPSRTPSPIRPEVSIKAATNSPDRWPYVRPTTFKDVEDAEDTCLSRLQSVASVKFETSNGSTALLKDGQDLIEDVETDQDNDEDKSKQLSTHHASVPDDPRLRRSSSRAIKVKTDSSRLKGKKRKSSVELPLLHSERSLKRGRPNPACSQVLGLQHETVRGNSNNPIEVKDEQLSSSPLSLFGISNHDSLDLDEVGRMVTTPRKQRRSRPIPSQSSSFIHAREAHSDIIHPRSVAVALDVSGSREKSHPDTNLSKRVGKPLRTRPNAVGFEPEDKSQDRRAVDLQVRQGLGSNANTEAGVLQPKSNNIRWLPETKGSTKTPRSSEKSSQGLGAHTATSPQPNGPSHNLLTALLEPSTGEKTNLMEERAQRSAMKQQKPASSFSLPTQVEGIQRQVRPVPKSQGLLGNAVPHLPVQELSRPKKDSLRPQAPTSSSRSNSQKHQQELSTPSDKQKGVPSKSRPLRALPNPELTPESFKVNPAYTGGFGYAFSETVRKHDERRCLPGCTRQGCCGNAFQKFVEFGDLPAPQRNGPRWNASSPISSEEADQRLLEEYLGSSRRDELDDMSDIERKELLVKAKTKQFADQHGRHRQRFERKRTPPGFWRTDMPTTQELQQDQISANMMERETVEERRREAMKEGGRWMFRDE